MRKVGQNKAIGIQYEKKKNKKQYTKPKKMREKTSNIYAQFDNNGKMVASKKKGKKNVFHAK